MKSVCLDEIPEEHTPKKFANFDDTGDATELILSHEPILQWCEKSRSQSN